ncbi:MAG: chemotaxis protein CheX [Clostridiales bacterium]|nr:chemotaxis protein CheX [Clostridiales bacterium]
MRARDQLVDIFVRSAKEIFASLGVSVEQAGEPVLLQQPPLPHPISITVSLHGAFEGVACYGMPPETAERVAAAMLQGMAEDEDPSPFASPLAQSALAELGNMITARAANLLGSNGETCDISVPMVVLDARKIVAGSSWPQLLVPLTSPLGDLAIGLASRQIEEV